MGWLCFEVLWRCGFDFLGMEYVILGGVMIWVFEHIFVLVILNVGGFGVIVLGVMSLVLFDE